MHLNLLAIVSGKTLIVFSEEPSYRTAVWLLDIKLEDFIISSSAIVTGKQRPIVTGKHFDTKVGLLETVYILRLKL